MGKFVFNSRRILRATTAGVTAVMLLISTSGQSSASAGTAQPVRNPLLAKIQLAKLPTDGERLSNILEEIEVTLAVHQKKASNGKSTVAEENRLQNYAAELDKLDASAVQDFNKVAKYLDSKTLPAIAKERYRVAFSKYRENMTALKANLKDIETQIGTDGLTATVEKARAQITKAKEREKRRPVDPNRNPMRALHPKRNNLPKTSKPEFQAAALFDNPNVQLAANGTFKYGRLAGASDPAYLAENTEVVFSNAIKQKAFKLDNDPIKIFNWVHDHTEWLPTWGAIQNSDVVLRSKKGNAIDLSTLLIALLRSSGIPARYVHGTIDVPVEKFMNWAGGFDDANSAWDYASSTGLPISAVRSGGKIIAFRMEHIWVEAALDFQPSRGVINRDADAWIQLDPSFKQYARERGYDMYKLMNINAEQYMMDYLSDPTDTTPYQFYGKKVLDFLNTSMPDWTTEGLYGQERIAPAKLVSDGNLQMFSSTLPYKTVLVGYSASTLSDSLRHRVRIGIGSNANNYTVALSELGGDRPTLSYVPETAADEAIAQEYGSIYDAPAYLVRVKPQLKKDGVLVAEGEGIGLGELQGISIEFISPTLIGKPVKNDIVAGSFLALVIQGAEIGNGQPASEMQDFSNNIDLNVSIGTDLDNLLGQLLHNIGVQWFYSILYERDLYATNFQMAYTRLPSEVITSADLTVSYWFGIPRSVSTGYYSVDADTDALAVGTLTANPGRVKDFMLYAGMSGSAWEHMSNKSLVRVEAVSAVKALKIATSSQIPVYFIDSSNAPDILPMLQLSQDDFTDVQNAILAGKKVIVSKNDIVAGAWKGVGIITFDLANGSGQYLISGGLSGAKTLSEFKDLWKKEVYNNPFKSIIHRSLILEYALSVVHTPYGLGCKLEGTQYGECAGIKRGDPDYATRVDCAGLVAYAYNKAGLLLFNDTWADKQMTMIRELDFGSHPSELTILPGDLKFWCCTQGDLSARPYNQGRSNGQIASHVGIHNYDGHWIAAQSGGVDIYSDFQTKNGNWYWQPKFIENGSIFKF